ncbi:MAG: TRAP transporter small permease subunit, partial [Rhodospirillaceae bacterium]
MKLFASVVAMAFAALLIWRMEEGLRDYIEYREITGILSIPLWYAFVPAVASLVLLLLAAVLTFVEDASEMKAARSGDGS